jgi:hypothetical protein
MCLASVARKPSYDHVVLVTTREVGEALLDGSSSRLLIDEQLSSGTKSVGEEGMKRRCVTICGRQPADARGLVPVNPDEEPTIRHCSGSSSACPWPAACMGAEATGGRYSCA